MCLVLSKTEGAKILMEHTYEEFEGRVTTSQQVIRYNHMCVGLHDNKTEFHNIIDASPINED